MMLSETRRKETRLSLRYELGAFALRHCANRALISGLYTLGELGEHNGQFELEDAAAELLLDERADDGVGSESDGDGDGGGLSRDGGGFAEKPRHFTEEEVDAVKWKCCMRKLSPEEIIGVMQRMPDHSIALIVEAYKLREARPAMTKKKKQQAFLLGRDCPLKDREGASKHFVDWCMKKLQCKTNARNTSELTGKTMEHLKRGLFPYGWFAQFCREHPN